MACPCASLVAEKYDKESVSRVRLLLCSLSSSTFKKQISQSQTVSTIAAISLVHTRATSSGDNHWYNKKIEKKNHGSLDKPVQKWMKIWLGFVTLKLSTQGGILIVCHLKYRKMAGFLIVLSFFLPKKLLTYKVKMVFSAKSPRSASSFLGVWLYKVLQKECP